MTSNLLKHARESGVKVKTYIYKYMFIYIHTHMCVDIYCQHIYIVKTVNIHIFAYI